MYRLNITLTLFAALLLTSCATLDCKTPVGYTLPGTDTAVVGIYLDKSGIPHETVKEIIVHPGDKVIYAGPEHFNIAFKNKKSPNNRINNESKDRVITIEIPGNIFELKEFLDEFNRNKSLTFDYDIIVNGKAIDPPLKVIPR